MTSLVLISAACWLFGLWLVGLWLGRRLGISEGRIRERVDASSELQDRGMSEAASLVLRRGRDFREGATVKKKSEIKIKGCPFVARKESDFWSIFYEPEDEPQPTRTLVVQMSGNRADVMARIRVLAYQREAAKP